jgi:hypothetical protein
MLSHLGETRLQRSLQKLFAIMLGANYLKFPVKYSFTLLTFQTIYSCAMVEFLLIIREQEFL